MVERGDFAETRVMAAEGVTIAKTAGHEFSRILATTLFG